MIKTGNPEKKDLGQEEANGDSRQYQGRRNSLRRERSQSPRRAGEEEVEAPVHLEERPVIKRGREEDEEEQEEKKRREGTKNFDTELSGALKKMQEELQKDVAEVYRLPRVTK